MNNDIRWIQRLDNFTSALKQLQAAAAILKKDPILILKNRELFKLSSLHTS